MHLFFLAFLSVEVVNCAKILSIFHVPSYSHYIYAEPLLKELAARGHQMTVINSYPQKRKFKNYRDVFTPELIDCANSIKNTTFLIDRNNKFTINNLRAACQTTLLMTNTSLQGKNVQKLINSNETFDLIIMEQCLNEAHFGFVHHFQTPLILMTSLTSWYPINAFMGNPAPYSYIPNLFVNLAPRMNFWQRTGNTLISIFQSLHYHIYYLPMQERIMRKYFPKAPPIHTLLYNASLVLLNSHPAIDGAIPLQPNMIEIGSLHLQKYEHLSEDLQMYLDKAEEGVIYLSLGTNVLSKHLPEEKLQAFLKAFSKLKMHVLWKWDNDMVQTLPNVRVEKWVPQAAVLAHKNVKLFITHGGHLSMIETVYFGKPILGIPLFFDQFNNIQKAVHFGYGLYLPYHIINEESLTINLKELIENPRFTEETKFRSNALRDLPVNPLNNAVNWVEYVIKHRGVPHLKNTGIDLKWYQYLLLDVLLCFIIITTIIIYSVSFLFSKIYAKARLKMMKQKMKRN